MRQRLLYTAAFAVLFTIECLIAVYVKDRLIRPYVGDILVTVLVCCFIRIFIPDGVKRLPFYVFLFAAGVELSQAFKLVDLLPFGQNRLVRIVLGSTFDLKDIVCYGVGCVLVWAWENRKRISSGRGA